MITNNKLRGADKMAKAILDLVNSGRIDQRSPAADALIAYAGLPLEDTADERAAAFRNMREILRKLDDGE